MLMRRIVPGFAVAFAMALFLKLYPNPESNHPQLFRTYQAMRIMCTTANMEKSAFQYVYPEARPSEWVSFLFSTLGSAEWPPIAGRELPEEEARAARIMVLPGDVTVVPLRARRNFAKQVVIRFDDSEGVVIAEGFEAWNEKSVFQRKWTIPKVTPSELAIQTAESNLEMGLGFATDFDTWGSQFDEFGVWEDTSP